MGRHDRRAAKVTPIVSSRHVSTVSCVRYQADIGVGAVYVATEKECVVDFTTPWYERVGFMLMMKAHKEKTDIWKFITIMDQDVWGVLFLVFFGTSAMIFFYER